MGGGKSSPRPTLPLPCARSRKSRLKISKNDVCPTHGAPPWTPHFFQFFFLFWTTGAPFYIFFFYISVLYYCVSLYIFTVFVHFFSIIEGRAVVIQPPQPVLDSSLNAVVVFNLEVTHAARFALKTTTAFKRA